MTSAVGWLSSTISKLSLPPPSEDEGLSRLKVSADLPGSPDPLDGPIGVEASRASDEDRSRLAEELDAARSTIYDRTERMVEHGLLVERTRIVEDGSHHSVFEANVDHLDVDVVDGELVVAVERRESAAERFTNIWNDIREV